MASRTLNIYSNDGQTLLKQKTFLDSSGNFVRTFMNNGLPVWGVTSDANTNPSQYENIFSDGTTFEGFAYSANQTSCAFNGSFGPQSYISQPNGFCVALISVGTAINLYLVNAVTPTPYRSFEFSDAKAQVASAIRDEDGVRIKTNYAKKSEVPNITISTSAPTGGNDGDIWLVYDA